MSLFKKDKSPSAEQAAAEHSSAQSGKQGGKGRPTPKRRDAEARNQRPLVPADRKAARRAAREAQNEAWERQRKAMETGDERYMPARDKGPIKRYIRDYVDARYSVGELFLPSTLAMILLVLGFSAVSRNQLAAQATFYLLVTIYALFLVAIVDAAICWRLVRRRLYDKFTERKVKEGGPIFWYVFSRCFNMRRWRQPAPQVARREYPS